MDFWQMEPQIAKPAIRGLLLGLPDQKFIQIAGRGTGFMRSTL